MMLSRSRAALVAASLLFIVAALPARSQVVTSSIDALKTSAASGDRTSQYQLGLAYRSGDRVPLNLQRAMYWFQRAALQCSAPAMDVLGQMYHAGGEGIDQNDELAARYYRLAAAQRLPAGLFDWGQALYENRAYLDEASDDERNVPGCPQLAGAKDAATTRSSRGDALFSTDPARLKSLGLQYIEQAAALGDSRARTMLTSLHRIPKGP